MVELKFDIIAAQTGVVNNLGGVGGGGILLPYPDGPGITDRYDNHYPLSSGANNRKRNNPSSQNGSHYDMSNVWAGVQSNTPSMTYDFAAGCGANTIEVDTWYPDGATGDPEAFPAGYHFVNCNPDAGCTRGYIRFDYFECQAPLLFLNCRAARSPALQECDFQVFYQNWLIGSASSLWVPASELVPATAPIHAAPASYSDPELIVVPMINIENFQENNGCLVFIWNSDDSECPLDVYEPDIRENIGSLDGTVTTEVSSGVYFNLSLDAYPSVRDVWIHD